MKRGSVFSLFLFFLASFSLNLASAEIFIGQPKSLYNMGDSFRINLTLSPNTKTIGFLSGSFVCGSESLEIYKSVQNLNANEQKNLFIETILDPSITGELSGSCFIRTSFGDDIVESQPFDISKDIDVSLNIEGIDFGPGESVEVKGKAIKRNREPLNGYVEVTIEGINISAVNKVDKGNFEVKFIVPDNIAPGSYNVNARAYEAGAEGTEMNEGKTSGIIKIKQIIKDLDIAFENYNVNPENDFTYNVLLYDQSGGRADGDVKVVIYDPNKKVFMQKLVKAGEQQTISIGANFTPDYWNIAASSGDLEDSKVFLVEKLEKLSFDLNNEVLTVKNVGNIRYTKPVEIFIGSVSEIKDIDLDIGESTKFRLAAPDGSYDIQVNDGGNQEKLGNTFLTGRAVGVDEVGDYLFGDAGVWIWALIIAILILVTLVLIRKIMRRNYIAKVPQIVSPLKKTAAQMSIPVSSQTVSPQHATPEVGIVDRGVKQEASVIALKIKNFEELQGAVNYQSNPLGGIDNVLLKVKSEGAKIYVDKDYRIIIFVPMVTKEKNNDIKAINSAKEIETTLNAYNKTLSQHIIFGIGVHVGEMAVELKDEKLRFASLGNTIAIAKRIAEYSKSEVLLSEQVHKKTLGKLKVEKLSDRDFWRVKQLISRENYEDFIQKFLNRQKR